MNPKPLGNDEKVLMTPPRRLIVSIFHFFNLICALGNQSKKSFSIKKAYTSTQNHIILYNARRIYV